MLDFTVRKHWLKQMLLACSLFGVVAAPVLRAQTTATILGTVTDNSGAAIPDTAMQVTNLGTGIMQSATSDAQGRFNITNLILGEYEVQASKAGFSTVVRKGITLSVGSQNVVDFSLPIGQQQQTVTVEGQVSQVETTSAAVSSLVDQTQMRELPLNGRNIETLILLAPGVSQSYSSQQTSYYGKAASYSISGSRPEGQGLLLDGQDIQNFHDHGTGSSELGTSLGVEGIAEFQMLTATFGAQLAGNGAVMNSVSKSGTNAIHGSAYEFLRNSALDARNFFDGPSVPAFRRNQFGGSLGGPIKKDKAFFFVNYEGLRQGLGETKPANVPDANARRGFLPCAAGSAGCSGGLLNVGVNLNMAAALALYPATNLVGANGITTVSQVASQVASENYFLGRIDYTLSAKDTLFVRFLSDKAAETEPFSAALIPLWPELDSNYNQFATIEERRIISPTLLNSIRASFSRPVAAAAAVGSTPALQIFPGAGRVDTKITVSGLNGQLGANANLPFTLVQNKFVEGDDVYWTHGAHNVKFGGEFRRWDTNSTMENNLGLVWTFTSLANFLQDRPSLVSGPLPGHTDATRDWREIGIQPYIQDDWKVSSRFTLNIGLRYEFVSNPVERRNKMTNIINPPFGTGFTPVSHVFISNPSLKNFDPRFGLAFDPFKDHKTSVRAGFGLFHDVIEPRTYGGGYWLVPPFATVNQANPVYPFAFAGSSPVVPTTTNSAGWYYPTRVTPYVFQYNLSIQRQIVEGTIVTLAYIGSQGRHLISDLELNPPIPNASGALATLVGGKIVTNPRINPLFGTTTYKMPLSSSSYNAFSASLERRLTHNLQAQVSYTYSKCMDYGSSTGGTEASNSAAIAENPYDVGTDHGRCTFDIPSILRVNGVFLLPFHGNKLIEGWQLSGIASRQTGSALTVNAGFDQTGLQYGAPRPNVISGCDAISGLKTQWFNPACFAIQPVGTFGNLGRTTYNGPSLVDFDFAVMKNTSIRKISEAFNVQFRAEVFNIFNHTNLGIPGLGAFTQGTNGGANPNTSFGVFTGTTTTSRQIQLGLKIVF